MSFHRNPDIRPHSNRLATAVGVPLLLFIWVSGCRPTAGVSDTDALSTSASSTVLKVNVSAAEFVNDAVETVVCFGRLQAVRGARPAFGRGGQVATIFKQQGDRVGQGELLAELEQTELEQQRLDTLQARQRLRTQLQDATGAEAGGLQQQLGQLDAKLHQLHSELAQGVIEAPFAGLIIRQEITAGQLVGPGMPAFQLVVEAPPQVETAVPQAIAQRLEPDQTFWVGFGEKGVVAKLRSQSPSADRPNMQRLVLEFTAPLADDSWQYGQVVETRFVMKSGSSGFWLPLSSLHRTLDGAWSVYVVERSTRSGEPAFVVATRGVKITLQQGDRVLVQGDLTADDTVILDGTHRVVPTQRVDPVTSRGEWEAPQREGITE